LENKLTLIAASYYFMNIYMQLKCDENIWSSKWKWKLSSFNQLLLQRQTPLCKFHKYPKKFSYTIYASINSLSISPSLQKYQNVQQALRNVQSSNQSVRALSSCQLAPSIDDRKSIINVPQFCDSAAFVADQLNRLGSRKNQYDSLPGIYKVNWLKLHCYLRQKKAFFSMLLLAIVILYWI